MKLLLKLIPGVWILQRRLSEGQTMSKCLRASFFAFQVLSVIPLKFVPEPVLLRVANHTECRCMEPAIIRRNAQPHRGSGWVQHLTQSYFPKEFGTMFCENAFYLLLCSVCSLAAARRWVSWQKRGTPGDFVPVVWFGIVQQTDAILSLPVHQVCVRLYLKKCWIEGTRP